MRTGGDILLPPRELLHCSCTSAFHQEQGLPCCKEFATWIASVLPRYCHHAINGSFGTSILSTQYILQAIHGLNKHSKQTVQAQPNTFNYTTSNSHTNTHMHTHLHSLLLYLTEMTWETQTNWGLGYRLGFHLLRTGVCYYPVEKPQKQMSVWSTGLLPCWQLCEERPVHHVGNLYHWLCCIRILEHEQHDILWILYVKLSFLNRISSS